MSYLMAIGFAGRSSKPAFHFRFTSSERRVRYVSQWLEAQDAAAGRKAERRAEARAKLAEPHALKVGDVLTGSWGYDQTNIEWWEVVKLVGKRMVLIRALVCESVATGHLQGECVPLPGQYTDGPALRKKVGPDGSVKLFDWGVWLRKEEPRKVAGISAGYRPRSWTSYA